ncbi:cation acetate symporter [Pseudonocardia sp. ICBG601]|uniref:solute symporter family protein n=1 Tax=Pseudonocardia sp. ICBG601 TaxID=2846759 RepID=UPI0035ABD6AA
MLGTAGLPHILMRFYTVPNAREARRSVVWAIWLIGLFYLFTLVLGYGAAALLPPGMITSANQNNAAPLLAAHLGGEIGLGLVSAIAFATILAVVAGLTITASASFAHDVYANVIKRGTARPDQEVRVARLTAVVVGSSRSSAGSSPTAERRVPRALAFAVAASANLPTILYSLFWKRFNTTGALYSIYGGLGLSIILIVFSPAVSGKAVNPETGRSASMIQGIDFHWFPLDNPGIISIPASFLLGIVGTFVGSRRKIDDAKYAEMEVRSLTGVGSEKAVSH